MQIQPYLFFDGRCEEAIDFYRSALGAEVEMMMRFKEAPADGDHPAPPAEVGDKIMHACLKIGEASFMASDGHCMNNAAFQGFAVSLTASDDADAQKKFAALGEGGQVAMPLGKTFFASQFGMVNDKFGVTWMVLSMT